MYLVSCIESLALEFIVKSDMDKRLFIMQSSNCLKGREVMFMKSVT